MVKASIKNRIRMNTPGPHYSIPDYRCPKGHAVYECSEPDNVYCPTCDVYWDPKQLRPSVTS